MAVETAIIAPVLLLMSLGGFEVSMMIARQSELQSAAAEAAAIVLAVSPDTQAKIDSIKSVIQASAGLADNQVAITQLYRCGTAATLATTSAGCAAGSEISIFLRIVMTQTYTPEWTRLGIGGPMTYRVSRTVQLS